MESDQNVVGEVMSAEEMALIDKLLHCLSCNKPLPVNSSNTGFCTLCQPKKPAADEYHD